MPPRHRPPGDPREHRVRRIDLEQLHAVRPVHEAVDDPAVIGPVSVVGRVVPQAVIGQGERQLLQRVGLLPSASSVTPQTSASPSTVLSALHGVEPEPSIKPA